VGNFDIRSRTHTQIQIEYLQYQSNARALINTSGEPESKSRRGGAYRNKEETNDIQKNSNRIIRHSRAAEKNEGKESLGGAEAESRTLKAMAHMLWNFSS
jgi:hypothetical protein